MPTIRNIIIFVVIAGLVVGGYMYYVKKPADTGNLVTDTSGGTSTALPSTGSVVDDNANIAQDFLKVLLNVKSIKLDDSIFSDPAFLGLHDSTIILTPDGDQGRPNPFAPFGEGNDNTSLSVGASIPVAPALDPTAPPASGDAGYGGDAIPPPNTTDKGDKAGTSNPNPPAPPKPPKTGSSVTP